MKDFIEIKNLSYAFDSYLAIDDLSFDIAKGEVVAIIGPNGSGKTTLLKNIIGIYSPTKGEIIIDGQKPQQVRKRIGYVPQKFEFERSTPITVKEFMSLEKCNQKAHGAKNINQALNQVGLEGVEHKRLSSLSGGQFQRVMIARALLHEKEILIFDEPSTGIDIAGEQTIYDLIVKINQTKGTTCLIVSHELNIVNKYAQRVLCLNKKMICYGIPEQVINPENLKKLYGIGAGLYHSH
ncbi:MAG: metal ABC transporter ATP-binding protein [Patescibacteria group bacterium]|jgi:zinc transport system ATP-binding protein|nr:metal ABC transporter ATP-binding protein [Patescibacteria group bacterium]